MTTPFASEIDEANAFYLRVRWLAPKFGRWDCEDPVSHAIVAVVEAQQELTDLFDDEVNGGHFRNKTKDEIKALYQAALEKRVAAAEQLVEALANREAWPDPELGHY